MVPGDSGPGSGFRQYLTQFSNNKKFVQNLAFSMSEAALYPRKLASHFFFLTFLLPYIESGSNSGSGTGSETVMHSGFGYAKANSYGSCGSSSKTLHQDIIIPLESNFMTLQLRSLFP